MNEQFNHILIESVLSTVFDIYNKKVVSTPSERANFDFVLKGDDGKKIAIEVKRGISPGNIRHFRNILAHDEKFDEFILITPNKPSSIQTKFFKENLATEFPNSKWFGFQEYLKNEFDLVINNNEDLVQLQIAAVTSKIENYSSKHIGVDLPNNSIKQSLSETLANAKKGEVKFSNILFSLRRQFPDKILSELSTESDLLAKQLYIGDKYNDAIIVLTDIKNFSTIVSAADPDDLNDAMSKYYTNARDLVFKYNGILDKFIGDAVLAIFNYPKKDVNSYLQTLKFCSELIELGEVTFRNLLCKMDQSVETGTRVGVANGPIYTLNIGKEGIEVTFIGDKINFAARLEKNCELNGILLSNRFYNKIEEEFFGLWLKLEIEKKELTPDEAKGQQLTTTSWQIHNNDLHKIIEY